MIFLSIIIATYNSGKTLRRCLDSIVPQLKEDCELFVIDGGSQDDTVAIINEYDSFITGSVSEPDNGVYDAWNKAIVKANGEWITFIGSDDQMCEGTIQAYRDFFSQKGTTYDLVCAKVEWVSQTGIVLKELGEPWNWKKLVYRSWSMAHPGMLHNKDLYHRIGLYNTDYKICADAEFLLRAGSHLRAAFIDRPMVKMQAGGLACGTAAIYEGYVCRKKLRLGNPVKNYLILLNKRFRRFIGDILRLIRSSK